VQANGVLKVHMRGGRKARYRLRADGSAVSPKSATTLTLKLRKGDRRRLRHGRRRHRIVGRLRAKVTVLASGSDGGSERRRLHARLKR
jgi:hypothetical protein